MVGLITLWGGVLSMSYDSVIPRRAGKDSRMKPSLQAEEKLGVCGLTPGQKNRGQRGGMIARCRMKSGRAASIAPACCFALPSSALHQAAKGLKTGTSTLRWLCRVPREVGLVLAPTQIILPAKNWRVSGGNGLPHQCLGACCENTLGKKESKECS